MAAHITDFVKAFLRNCPNVRLTDDEQEELERLFRLRRYTGERKEVAECWEALPEIDRIEIESRIAMHLAETDRYTPSEVGRGISKALEDD